MRAGEAPPVKDSQSVIDRVVAVVNDDVVMMSELQEAIVVARRDGRSLPDGPDLERTMLNRLVDNRLQIQEARRDKIEITDDELRGYVEDFVKRNGGDRDKLAAQLQVQGVTWDALRREMRDQLLAQRVVSRRVVRRATITEAEVDQYLAENRAKFEAGLKYHAFHMAIAVEARAQRPPGSGRSRRSRVSRSRWRAVRTSPSWRAPAPRTRPGATSAG